VLLENFFFRQKQNTVDNQHVIKINGKLLFLRQEKSFQNRQTFFIISLVIFPEYRTFAIGFRLKVIE
jgi:hypothetical protein